MRARRRREEQDRYLRLLTHVGTLADRVRELERVNSESKDRLQVVESLLQASDATRERTSAATAEDQRLHEALQGLDALLQTCECYPQSAPKADKDAWRDAGLKRQCGRGVCVNCYGRYRKAGRIDELAFVRGSADPNDPQAKVCGRCGIKHAMSHDLCQDCRLVVADLGELDAWETPSPATHASLRPGESLMATG